MKPLSHRPVKAAMAAALFGVVLSPVIALADDGDRPHHRDHDRIRHVLLISIDGFHAVDLQTCVAAHTCPHLARLAEHGTTYTHASTTKPSDSFPGLLAQLTGGTSKSTGVYYDDSYDRKLFAPATNSPGGPCTSGPGAETQYAENLGVNQHSIDSGVPASLTGLNSAIAIDPNNLPGQLVHGTCKPLWPHDFIRTNTIFGVLHQHHLRTAWSDKHAAYDIVNGNDPDTQPTNGPGTNVDDFFAPEINSDLSQANVQLVHTLGLQSTAPDPTTTPCPGPHCKDFTSSIDGVEFYDGIKVQAILNEIHGFDHTGRFNLAVPTLFGMNFQSVSVGQKLKIGGYKDAIGTPTNNLLNAIEFVDRSIGLMLNALHNARLSEKTLVIVSAKHGQSPIDRTKRVALDDGAVIATPIGANFAFDIADDGVLIWLKSNSGGRTEDAVDKLQGFPGDTGIKTFLFGPPLAAMFQDPAHDSRAPDIIGITRVGVIYTGGSKIAEHGGFNEQDVHVALVVSHPDFDKQAIDRPVATTQIAPTILTVLGLNPSELEAVRLEHTKVLPDFE
jgi:predicted AlkP superfamily pyrophosphatase or phosphodiesterase